MNILNTIGNTPLIEIDGIYAKLETTNPTGSIKDRMATYIIKMAERRGELKPNDQIIEVTSGNTGIALAMISAIKGYKFTAVMAESMSLERRRMMEAFNAKIILTPAKDDIKGAIKKYNELIKKYPNAYLPKQFENPDNIEAHRKGLGQEILKQAPNIQAFVAGTGTGGTLIGTALALKKSNPNIKIIAVEPAESAVLSGKTPNLHRIQGIGEGFIPKIVQDNLPLIDDVITVKSIAAIKASKLLTKKYGVLVGISSGANFLAAQSLKSKFTNIVTVFSDRGERYLTTASNL
ncbi:MAG: cysteine synthase family protein [Candidatus Peregrinibacteria bacterium]